MTSRERTNENLQPKVSAGQIAAIVESARLEVKEDDRRVARLKKYLALVIEELIRKAPTRKSLTPSEMRAVEILHDTFDELLRSFQTVGNPPPMLPTISYESGQSVTLWQRWLYGLDFWEDGKSETLNWAAVGELLSIYQHLFDKRLVSENASKPFSSQAAFLKAAYDAVKSGVTPELIRMARGTIKLQPARRSTSVSQNCVKTKSTSPHPGSANSSRRTVNDILVT